MKAFAASALIVAGILVAGASAPVAAAPEAVTAAVESAAVIEAPAAELGFERVAVQTVAAPVVEAPKVEVVAAAAVEGVAAVEAPVMVNGVNPECAEQWMQTAADGTCLPTECAVAGQVLTVEGNCVEQSGPVLFDNPTTTGNGQVQDNGNPACDVPGAIQYSDGSCTFAAEEDLWVPPMPGEGPIEVLPGAPAKDSTGDTAPNCDELEIGDAWAGVGTHCGAANGSSMSWFPNE